MCRSSDRPNPCDGLGLRIVQVFRDPKISHLHRGSPFTSKKDIFTFDISVQDASIMDMLQSKNHLDEPIEYLRFRKRSTTTLLLLTLDFGVEIASFGVFLICDRQVEPHSIGSMNMFCAYCQFCSRSCPPTFCSSFSLLPSGWPTDHDNVQHASACRGRSRRSSVGLLLANFLAWTRSRCESSHRGGSFVEFLVGNDVRMLELVQEGNFFHGLFATLRTKLLQVDLLVEWNPTTTN
jgi:hypothetical protein